MKVLDSPLTAATPATQSSPVIDAPSNLRLLCWLAVFATGLLEAWGHRFQVEFDGVSYLDVATNYLRGNWHDAVNAYWSPLYSWLLAIPLSFFHSSLYWESTLLHLVNFALLLASYAAFEFMMSELARSPLALSMTGETSLPLTERAWRILGLAIFLFSSLFLANYNGSTPDLCVMVAVYAATGLVLRIQSERAGLGTYASLGIALGMGYLAKAAMFPLAFIFIGGAWFATASIAKVRLKLLAAVLAFAVISGPWILLLSRSKGRVTFGDSGKLAYISAMSTAWKSGFKGFSTVQGPNIPHPIAILGTHPETLGFAKPVSGTFPPWYDSTYWEEGAEAHFSLRNQLAIFHGSYDAYLDILESEKTFLVGLLVLLLVQGSFRAYVSRLARYWPLWLPSLAAIGMYSLVLVQTRYVAAFLAVIWICLFAAIRLRNARTMPHLIPAIPFAILLVVALPIARNLVSDVYHIFRPQPHEQWELAQGLHRAGVPSDQAVAIVGLPEDTFEWARLAGVRVVAAIPPEAVDEYWSAPPDTKARVDSLFHQAGAMAEISFAPPPGQDLAGWAEIGSSSHFVRLIPEAPENGSRHPSD